MIAKSEVISPPMGSRLGTVVRVGGPHADGDRRNQAYRSLRNLLKISGQVEHAQKVWMQSGQLPSFARHQPLRAQRIDISVLIVAMIKLQKWTQRMTRI